MVDIDDAEARVGLPQVGEKPEDRGVVVEDENVYTQVVDQVVEIARHAALREAPVFGDQGILEDGFESGFPAMAPPVGGKGVEGEFLLVCIAGDVEGDKLAAAGIEVGRDEEDLVAAGSRLESLDSLAMMKCITRRVGHGFGRLDEEIAQGGDGQLGHVALSACWSPNPVATLAG